VQRLAQRIVPRLCLVAGLGSLALVVQGLTLLLPAPWTAPALVATENGFVVAWLDGREESVPLRVMALGSDLSPRGGSRRVGSGGPLARILLDHDSGRGTSVRVVGGFAQSSLRVIAVVDDDGRPVPAAPPIRGRTAELRPPPEAPDRSPNRRCHALPAGSSVRDVWGQARARIALSSGGWARFAPVPGGRALVQERIGPARCHALAGGPCVAAAADEQGVVVAWTRSHALGSELVVTRLPWEGGPAPTEIVLRRSPSFALALAFVAFVGLIIGLAGHALALAVEAARVVCALGPRRRGTWVDGTLVAPGTLVVGPVSSYRMRTAAATLHTAGGENVCLRAGRPLVVTGAALEGERPSLAAAVATFEHVWAAGTPCHESELGPYRGGGRALAVQVLADRPLSLVRAAMVRNLLWSTLDALGLGTAVVLACASIL
jgi:hypothetical protein